MAGQLLLINPRKRGGTKRRRSAAQRAATARLVAMNRARRSGASHTKRRRTRRHASSGYRTNPAPVVRSRLMRRRRRNPISMGGASLGFSTRQLMAAAKHAGIAAGGALAVDYAFGFVKGYLPASVQTPVDASGAMNPLYYLAKGLAAVAAGVFGAKLVGRGTAARMAEGSLVVTAYTALRNVLPAGIASGLGYYQPAATNGPDLPGYVNQSARGSANGSITDLRAYLSAQGGGSRNTRQRTAYDNPGMAAYLSR